MPHFKESGPNPFFLNIEAATSVNGFAAMGPTGKCNLFLGKSKAVSSPEAIKGYSLMWFSRRSEECDGLGSQKGNDLPARLHCHNVTSMPGFGNGSTRNLN